MLGSTLDARVELRLVALEKAGLWRDKYSGIARVANARAITLAACANTRRGIMASRPARVS